MATGDTSFGYLLPTRKVVMAGIPLNLGVGMLATLLIPLFWSF